MTDSGYYIFSTGKNKTNHKISNSGRTPGRQSRTMFMGDFLGARRVASCKNPYEMVIVAAYKIQVKLYLHRHCFCRPPPLPACPHALICAPHSIYHIPSTLQIHRVSIPCSSCAPSEYLSAVILAADRFSFIVNLISASRGSCKSQKNIELSYRPKGEILPPLIPPFTGGME